MHTLITSFLINGRLPLKLGHVNFLYIVKVKSSQTRHYKTVFGKSYKYKTNNNITLQLNNNHEEKEEKIKIQMLNKSKKM